MTGVSLAELTGDELAGVLTALASPHRLRILAALVDESAHVSELARRLGMGRPLLYLHLKKLEAARLIEGRLELSDDGKALKFFSVRPFLLRITPEEVVRAVETLTLDQKT